MKTATYSARIVSPEICHTAHSIDRSNVLIYFPHGFGDFVQLSYVTSHLNRNNRYWITQFGDDNASVFEGHSFIAPIYSGVNSARLNFGDDFGIKHFLMNYDDANGNEQLLELPLNLFVQCKKHRIDTVLWTNFPE